MKISSGLYETILPMVKQQVESQIKVRDLSHTSVSIAPADYASWHDVRTELMAEVCDCLQPNPVLVLMLSTFPKFFTGQDGLQGSRGG